MRKALLAITLIALATPAFAADKFAGTWKLNAEKSTGPERMKAAQLVAEDQGGDHVVTVSGENPDGSPSITKFSVPLKGGSGRIIEGSQLTGVTAQPFTPRVEDFTFTIGDKPAVHIHSVVSRDGKTMTTTRTVMGGQMQPGTYKDVWERQ